RGRGSRARSPTEQHRQHHRVNEIAVDSENEQQPEQSSQHGAETILALCTAVAPKQVIAANMRKILNILVAEPSFVASNPDHRNAPGLRRSLGRRRSATVYPAHAIALP